MTEDSMDSMANEGNIDRPSMREMVRQHVQPVEDLVACYRILHGNEAVNAVLRELNQRVIDRIRTDR